MQSETDTFVVAFAGGGTGGHLYPALAVADALRQRCSSARFIFFGTGRSVDAHVLGDADVVRQRRVEGGAEMASDECGNVGAADDHRARRQVPDRTRHAIAESPRPLGNARDLGGPEAALGGKPVRRHRKPATPTGVAGDPAKNLPRRGAVETPRGTVTDASRQAPFNVADPGRLGEHHEMAR